MSYLDLAYLHLGTVMPAFLIGTYLLFTEKGTGTHKKLGRIYMVLMLVTATITLFMKARVGPVFLNHFGYIHSLSMLTIYTVPFAYFAAKKGNSKKHKSGMIGLYAGGIIIAGSFALMPGRLLHGWIFGQL
ncbi:MAG: DUF2306 domain-containing protein [Desulfobacterales bacterium]|nr:DUF2306 domain-containing protein [Desulfobacterales bacterium]